MFNLPSFTLPWTQPRSVETVAAPEPIGRRSQNGSGKPTTHSKRRKASRKASRR